jgi:hypothetical protein
VETANNGVKLGRTELILVLAGLIAFISSFMHWFQASVSAAGLGSYYAGSTNGWSSGIAAWGAILLLMAVGVMAVLPRFDVAQKLRGRYRLFTILSAIALVLVIIRWVSYPTTSASESGTQLSEGAGLGTFLCLLAALAATGFSYMALRAERRPPVQATTPAEPLGFPGQQ